MADPKRWPLLVALGVILGTAPAQGDAPAGAGAATEFAGPLEKVTAIVGNEVILHSTIDRAVHLRLPMLQGLSDEPDLATKLRLQLLRELVEQSMLAQTARTLGAYDPEQVSQYVEHAVRQREADEIERSGSYSQFVKDLHDLQIPWETIADEERNKTLREFAEQQVAFGLLGARRYLLFTPQEMLDYYQENLADFVVAAHTDLASVGFADPEKAAEAAEAWSSSSASAEEIERHHGGLLVKIYTGAESFPGLAEGEAPPASDSRAPFLWEVAQHQGVGLARAIQVGSVTWVVKVLDRVEGSRREFLDRSVQGEIREALSRRFSAELRNTAFRRAQRRIHLWAPELGRF